MTALTEALRLLGEGRDLSVAEARAAVAALMEGSAPEAAVAAFLTALRVKGETAEELAGAVQAVRERMAVWEPLEPARPLLDTCGTGGDGACSVNVSTAVAVIAAACGIAVAKHGNRSASGNSGSAEVLAELGVAVEAEPCILRRSLAELGLTFLFAPAFHPALRLLAPIRRQLPFRTIFNLVGPLANPARPGYQLVGVPSERLAELVSGALAQLGTTRAAVVTGADGLDEVTLDGPTTVRLVESGRVSRLTWHVEDFGLPRVRAEELRVSGPADSAARIRAVLAGEPEPAREVMLANTSAALWVAGRAATLAEGVRLAREAIDSGSARALLERWGRLSRGAD